MSTVDTLSAPVGSWPSMALTPYGKQGGAVLKNSSDAVERTKQVVDLGCG